MTEKNIQEPPSKLPGKNPQTVQEVPLSELPWTTTGRLQEVVVQDLTHRFGDEYLHQLIDAILKKVEGDIGKGGCDVGCSGNCTGSCTATSLADITSGRYAILYSGSQIEEPKDKELRYYRKFQTPAKPRQDISFWIRL